MCRACDSGVKSGLELETLCHRSRGGSERGKRVGVSSVRRCAVLAVAASGHQPVPDGEHPGGRRRSRMTRIAAQLRHRHMCPPASLACRSPSCSLAQPGHVTHRSTSLPSLVQLRLRCVFSSGLTLKYAFIRMRGARDRRTALQFAGAGGAGAPQKRAADALVRSSYARRRGRLGEPNSEGGRGGLRTPQQTRDQGRAGKGKGSGKPLK